MIISLDKFAVACKRLIFGSLFVSLLSLLSVGGILADPYTTSKQQGGTYMAIILKHDYGGGPNGETVPTMSATMNVPDKIDGDVLVRLTSVRGDLDEPDESFDVLFDGVVVAQDFSTGSFCYAQTMEFVVPEAVMAPIIADGVLHMEYVLSDAVDTGCSETAYATDPIFSINSLRAYWQPSYGLEIETQGSGTVTSSAGLIDCSATLVDGILNYTGTCLDTYLPISMPTLYAEPAFGYEFAGWINCTPNSATPEECTPVMPIPADLGGFTSANTWTDDPLVLAGLKVTAVFDPLPQIVLSIDGGGDGTGTTTSPMNSLDGGDALDCLTVSGSENPLSNCQQTNLAGETLIITAEANLLSEFAGWNGSCLAAGGETSGINNTECELLIGDEQITLTPQYIMIPTTALIIDGSGSGKGTTSSLANSLPGGEALNCLSNAGVEDPSTNCQQIVEAGETVSITATTDISSTFIGWENSCTSSGGTQSGGQDEICTITITENAVTLTPVYKQIPYATLSIVGGSEGSGWTTSSAVPLFGTEPLNCLSNGDVNDPDTNCLLQTSVGETVSVVALSTSLSTFEGWAGSCVEAGGSLSGSGEICTLTLNVDVTTLTPVFVANFDVGDDFEILTVFAQGSGWVSASPSSIDCYFEMSVFDSDIVGDVCSGKIEALASGEPPTATITATPAVGFVFVEWLNCDLPAGNVCIETMDEDAETVTALFEEGVAKLGIKLTGNGLGDVFVEGAAFNYCSKPTFEDATCTTVFLGGQDIIFAAEPQIGYLFSGWDNCDSVNGNVCTMSLSYEDVLQGIIVVQALFASDESVIGHVNGNNPNIKDVPKLSEAEIAKIKEQSSLDVGKLLRSKNQKAKARKPRRSRSTAKSGNSRLKLGSETYDTALPINLAFGKNGDFSFDGDLQSIMGSRMDGSKLNLWTEGALSGFVGNKETKSGTLQVGADFQANKDMMFGLSTAYDWDKSLVGDTFAKTSSLTLSAYTDMKLGSGLNFNAGGSWTNSDNKLAGSGEFGGETLQFDARLSGNQKIGDFTLSPALSASYVKSIQDAFTHQEGVFIASQSLSEGRIAVGPRVTYSASSIFKPWLGVNAAYTMTKENGLRSEVTSGQVEAGLNYIFTGGSSLNMSGSYDTDQKSKAAVTWSIPLN